VKEARSDDYDLVEGNTVDGVRTHGSQACEKGIGMKVPSERTTTASVLGPRGIVRRAGRGLDWEATGRCWEPSDTCCIDT
jgi:hypothetical protein